MSHTNKKIAASGDLYKHEKNSVTARQAAYDDIPPALQHPTRILARQRADRVKLAQLIFTQANSGGGNVILQLLGPFGANNNAGDRRLMQ